MPSGDTFQENNHVEGDLAGRDITKYYIENKHFSVYIEELCAKYKDECENDTKLSSIREKLKRYSSPATNDVRGLDDKLSATGYSTLLSTATKYKERYAKKLSKQWQFESGQALHEFLLAEVESRFDLHIRPILSQTADASKLEQILQSIQLNILDPIQQKLGSNPLELDGGELQGMLYFLTGNCHINWD